MCRKRRRPQQQRYSNSRRAAANAQSGDVKSELEVSSSCLFPSRHTVMSCRHVSKRHQWWLARLQVVRRRWYAMLVSRRARNVAVAARPPIQKYSQAEITVGIWCRRDTRISTMAKNCNVMAYRRKAGEVVARTGNLRWGVAARRHERRGRCRVILATR